MTLFFGLLNLEHVGQVYYEPVTAVHHFGEIMVKLSKMVKKDKENREPEVDLQTAEQPPPPKKKK